MASAVAGFLCAGAGHFNDERSSIRVEQPSTPPGYVPARPYFVTDDPARARRGARNADALTLPVFTLAFVIALRERRRGVLL
ncbi:hypothetical protein [Pseudonocardia sp. TRM90224]|uniref:hypothetical protein n=1 Tax=Pseudonocardia sp. TRM90224 TaxID=2812678 RepID=UPI001E5A6CE0|nr:hypothetical protein [Pseudonocardia sp. TRM90224]